MLVLKRIFFIIGMTFSNQILWSFQGFRDTGQNRNTNRLNQTINKSLCSSAIETLEKKDTIKSKLLPPDQKPFKALPKLILVEKEPSNAEKYREYIKNILVSSSFSDISDVENLRYKENEIIFCQTLPLIGAKALCSKEIINGINAHFNAINEQGGIAGNILRLISINDSGNPLLTHEIIKKIVLEKNLKMFFGNIGEDNLFSIFSMIKDKALLMLFPFAYHKAFLSPYLKNIINGCNHRELQLDKILEFVVHSLRIRESVGIFFADDEFGKYQMGYLQSRLKEMKVRNIYSSSYNPENPKIINEAKKLIAQSPKVVIALGSYMANTRLIIEFLNEKMIDTSFIGTEEIYFSTKILEDLIEKNNQEKSIKIHCVTFVPDPEDKSCNYEFVRNYLNDLNRLAQKVSPDIRLAPSPLGLIYYLNAKVISTILKKIFIEHQAVAIDQDTLIPKIIHSIENLRDENLGDYFADFDYVNRCAYPIMPNIV